MTAKPMLKRYSDRPILSPRPGHWDAVSVFNPGAIDHDGRVHMLYRAVRDQGPYVSRFGYAQSADGIHFERVVSQPVYQPQFDWEIGGVEDARITPDPDRSGAFLVSYAAPLAVPGPGYKAFNFWRKLDQDPACDRPNLGPSCTGLLRTRDFQSFESLGYVTPQGLDDRDGILFPEKIDGRYAMLHRPTAWQYAHFGTDRPSIWIAFSDDLKSWDYGRGSEFLLMKPRDGLAADWESGKIGGSAPPIHTDAGWLMLYHGVDRRHVYRVGAALLATDDPFRVLGRTDQFLLEPELEWERHGVIPNVVFPTANIVRGDDLLVYYGAADKYIGLARGSVTRLLEQLTP